MNLAFSQQWPDGTPTYFIEKIWQGLEAAQLVPWNEWHNYLDDYNAKFGREWDGTLVPMDFDDFGPKLHTIRAGNRWKAGDKIHFIVNNRSKDRFQFAPVLEVKSVQDIHMHFYDETSATIFVADKIAKRWEEQAINDGFESWEAFVKFFYHSTKILPGLMSKIFIGQIIHWTDLKY